jgi:hypothetical protein
VSLVPVASLPLFAFANDGTRAWLRASGPRLLAVDPHTGEVLHEVRLDPAPFGFTWHVERHGDLFVVRDDREIAAYDGGGVRLWKRTWPTKVAILGQPAARGDGRHVSVAPGPLGVDVLLADLQTGAFDAKLRVPGSMDHVGANGVVVNGMLFFATDQREAFVVDVEGFQVATRHDLGGSRILPPVVTTAGVHVAVVDRRPTGSITRVSTLDAATGTKIGTSEIPGETFGLSVGASGLVLDVARRDGGTDRVAFRPVAPHVRLVLSKHVEMSIVRGGGASAPVEILPPTSKREGRRDEILPVRAGSPEGPGETPREGWLGLLALLGARSRAIPILAEALAAPARLESLASLGLELRDPRVRWSAGPRRDPCLVDIARLGNGDLLATYFYPPGRLGTVPVVQVAASSGRAAWLADDFDTWFASFLHDAARDAPDRVANVLADLDLPQTLLHAQRARRETSPPAWFFEAHSTTHTVADADAALQAGDVEGAERMLVSAARAGRGEIAPRLASIYEMLGWAHQRAIVAETW